MKDASCPKGKKMGAEKKINRCLAIWKIPINKFLGNRNFEFVGLVNSDLVVDWSR